MSAVIVATSLAAGCTGPTPTAQPPVPSTVVIEPVEDATTRTVPAGVEMFFDYPRYLWHTRRLGVATTNTGTEPLSIASIAVRSDHFEPLEPESKRTIIGPGQRIDVQVDFGALTTCSTGDAADAAVLIEIARGDQDPVRYLAPLDPSPLDEIRDRECAARIVADAATIAFSDDRSVDGATMTTSIEIVRENGTPTIEVTSLSGSVILALVPIAARDPLARLDPDVASADIPITVEVTRCDPHVVSQSSRTFDLAVFVTVGEAPTHRHQLEVDAELEAAFRAMIEHCAAQLPDR